MESKSTHIIFDGTKIVISPDLHPIIIFLQGIEEEIEILLGFYKKLESIREQSAETFELIDFLAKKLKENSIDFNFNLSEKPETLIDKLTINRPIRSEVIALFAHLETLFCLNIAYKNKTSDQAEIIKKAMDQNNVKLFLTEFCLNKENEWGNKHPERFKRITADELRRLRNSLTHFFSVSRGLSLSYALLDEKSRRLEKATNYKAKFISPEDLYEIIKGAAKLMIIEWSKDCTENLSGSSNDFKARILCVKNVVEASGAIIIKNAQINI